MAISDSNGSKSQLPKRFACDRCREHKLRCPRDQQTGDSCPRCVRAGAQCVTSNCRRLGRPSKTANAQSTRGRSNTISKKNGRTVIASTRVKAEQSPESRNLEDPTESLSSWFQTRDSDLFGIGSDLFLESQHANDDAIFAPVLDNNDPELYFPSGSSLAEFEALKAYSDFSGGSRSCSDGNASSAQDNMDVRSKESKGQQRDKLSSKVSLVQRLSTLHTCLSEQLDQLSTALCSTTLLSVVCSSGLSHNGTDQPPSNSLESALRSTLEFLDIINSLESLNYLNLDSFAPASHTQQLFLSGLATPPSPCGTVQPSQLSLSHTESGYATRSESVSSTDVGVAAPIMDIPTVLVVLACYIELIHVFDVLLRRLHKTLLEPLEHSASSNQTPNGPQFGGSCAHFENLQICNFLQVVERRFSQIEQVLGLAPEFRLDSNQTPYHGILSTPELTPILQTIMTQKLGQNSYNEHGRFESAGDISSLRRVITEIRRLLQSSNLV